MSDDLIYRVPRDNINHNYNYKNLLVTDYASLDKYPNNHSDYFLNITNHYTLDYISNYANLVMLSSECSINDIKGVMEVKYKSKSEWKLEISEYSSDIAAIFDSYDENPLRDSFIVKVNNVNKLEKITDKISKLEKVQSADYGKNAVDTIISVFDVAEKVVVIVVIALLFVTAFLMTNTIKLTIYSRKNEIEIMRLVGASNTAIKLPFVFEGFIIGVLGSLIPSIVVIYGYVIAYDKLGGHIISNLIKLIEPYNFVFNISIVLVIFGSLIGMYGSLRAVIKYLKI